MLELTKEDRQELYKISQRRFKPTASVGGLREECFAAGLAAGIKKVSGNYMGYVKGIESYRKEANVACSAEKYFQGYKATLQQ